MVQSDRAAVWEQVGLQQKEPEEAKAGSLGLAVARVDECISTEQRDYCRISCERLQPRSVVCEQSCDLLDKRAVILLLGCYLPGAGFTVLAPGVGLHLLLLLRMLRSNCFADREEVLMVEASYS